MKRLNALPVPEPSQEQRHFTLAAWDRSTCFAIPIAAKALGTPLSRHEKDVFANTCWVKLGITTAALLEGQAIFSVEMRAVKEH